MRWLFASLLVTGVLFGCSCGDPLEPGAHGSRVQVKEVTPWFRVRVERARVLAPHLFAWGENRGDGYAKVDGKWTHVAEGHEDIVVYPLGQSLLVLSDTGRTFLREGSAQGIELPDDACPNFIPRADVARVVCLGCGSQPPLVSLHETVNRRAPCETITVSERDDAGRVLWSKILGRSNIPSSCVGPTAQWAFDANGEPIVKVECQRPEGRGWVTREFAATADGFRELTKDDPRRPAATPWGLPTR